MKMDNTMFCLPLNKCNRHYYRVNDSPVSDPCYSSPVRSSPVKSHRCATLARLSSAMITNTNTSPCQGVEKAVKVAGYLEKKSKMKVVNRWKKHWFVLDGRLLLYYKSQVEYRSLSPCRGTVNMGLAANVVGAKHCQIIISTRSHTVALRALNRAEHAVWLQALVDAMYLPGCKLASTAAVSIMPNNKSFAHNNYNRYSAADELEMATSECLVENETLPEMVPEDEPIPITASVPPPAAANNATTKASCANAPTVDCAAGLLLRRPSNRRGGHTLAGEEEIYCGVPYGPAVVERNNNSALSANGCSVGGTDKIRGGSEPLLADSRERRLTMSKGPLCLRDYKEAVNKKWGKIAMSDSSIPGRFTVRDPSEGDRISNDNIGGGGVGYPLRRSASVENELITMNDNIYESVRDSLYSTARGGRMGGAVNLRRSDSDCLFLNRPRMVRAAPFRSEERIEMPGMTALQHRYHRLHQRRLLREAEEDLYGSRLAAMGHPFGNLPWPRVDIYGSNLALKPSREDIIGSSGGLYHYPSRRLHANHHIKSDTDLTMMTPNNRQQVFHSASCGTLWFSRTRMEPPSLTSSAVSNVGTVGTEVPLAPMPRRSRCVPKRSPSFLAKLVGTSGNPAKRSLSFLKKIWPSGKEAKWSSSSRRRHRRHHRLIRHDEYDKNGEDDLDDDVFFHTNPLANKDLSSFDYDDFELYKPREINEYDRPAPEPPPDYDEVNISSGESEVENEICDERRPRQKCDDGDGWSDVPLGRSEPATPRQQKGHHHHRSKQMPQQSQKIRSKSPADSWDGWEEVILAQWERAAANARSPTPWSDDGNRDDVNRQPIYGSHKKKNGNNNSQQHSRNHQRSEDIYTSRRQVEENWYGESGRGRRRRAAAGAGTMDTRPQCSDWDQWDTWASRPAASRNQINAKKNDENQTEKNTGGGKPPGTLKKARQSSNKQQKTPEKRQTAKSQKNKKPELPAKKRLKDEKKKRCDSRNAGEWSESSGAALRLLFHHDEDEDADSLPPPPPPPEIVAVSLKSNASSSPPLPTPPSQSGHTSPENSQKKQSGPNEDLDAMLKRLHEINTSPLPTSSDDGGSRALAKNLKNKAILDLEPDYDIPRPHASLVKTLRKRRLHHYDANSVLPPTHFLQPSLNATIYHDSLDPNISARSYEEMMMAPDSLECDPWSTTGCTSDDTEGCDSWATYAPLVSRHSRSGKRHHHHSIIYPDSLNPPLKT